MHLTLDLTPTPNALLIGSVAPELTQIKEWKNGGPVTLAGLRGKVVLLDFWGYWCGPCVGEMPAMMALDDQFKDKGLVIVAVHNDTVGSIAEMDQKLSAARQKFWDGRDLPFLVALDGGGETRIKGSGLTTLGATTAAYGVQDFPTTLLIGPDGVVIDKIDIRDAGARQEIEKALHLIAPAAK